MSKGKVSMLTTDFSTRSGGVYEAIAGQALALRRADRDVDVVNFAATDGERAAGSQDITVHDVPADGIFKTLFSNSLVKTLENNTAQVLHTHGLWIPAVSIQSRTWRARSKGRFVLSPHGMLDPWALENAKWKKRTAMALFERATLQAADCLHALNRSEAQAMRALGLMQPIAVVPNGVDLPTPKIAISPLPDDGRKVLLFLGRLHPKKGLAETLEAWSTLLVQRPEISKKWRLVIAGWDDGGHQQALEKRVAELSLEKEVRFLGAVYGAEKNALLAQASAFVLASRSEGLPMAVLEAWANKLPVFMSKECNLPEGFAAGAAIDTGTQPHEIATAFELNLERDDLNDIGEAGRRLVEARFTWDSVGLQLDAVYAWLLGETDMRPETVLT
ncbi:glycosyltransferase [Planktotalea sp.]|uniref:glycosyltransferase n=1 Tax=Planktotalea sp. TaxID=2029877 RepID=UPI0032990517